MDNINNTFFLVKKNYNNNIVPGAIFGILAMTEGGEIEDCHARE